MSGSSDDRSYSVFGVKIKAFGVKIKALLRKTPILGPLVDCRLKDHGETLRQIPVTLLLSTAPFWLGALVLYVTRASTTLTLRNAFWSTIWDGELFMCATSLLAPILVFTTDDPNGARKFPSRLSHLVLLFLIIALASVFYGLGLANNHLKEPFTFHLSVWVFWLAAGLLYLSTLYHVNRLPDAPAAFREDEENFTKSYRRHRK